MADHVSVPRRFLTDFLKALNFHGGHGTPNFDRVHAEALHAEATQLLTDHDHCPCGAEWNDVCFAYDGPHCAKDDGSRFLTGQGPCEALCRECKSDGICLKRNPFYIQFAERNRG